jgi:hypothetical protein
VISYRTDKGHSISNDLLRIGSWAESAPLIHAKVDDVGKDKNASVQEEAPSSKQPKMKIMKREVPIIDRLAK